jgi:polyisoprenoid-binding protein YceI
MSTATQQETQTIPAGTWQSDPIHSSVGFAVRHMVVSTFHGQLPEFHATLTSTPEGASLTGTAPLGVVTTDQADLTAHLLSAEFFDVERHPTATFRSERIEREGEDGVVVSGELTIKGITRPVELRGQIVGPVADPYGNEHLGLELSGTIDRFDYDMRWSMPLPDGGVAVGREVRLTANLELLKEA